MIKQTLVFDEVSCSDSLGCSYYDTSGFIFVAHIHFCNIYFHFIWNHANFYYAKRNAHLG